MWATLGSAALQAASAYATNKARLANQNSLFSEQINLANTAHQREVADLRLAGLNPILSAQGAGSSTPNPEAANLENPADGLSANINSGRALKQQQDLRDAQVASMLSNAKAQQTQADNGSWVIFNARDMGGFGFNALGFGAGGKAEKIQSIRVNKLTGEVYDLLSGRRLKDVTLDTSPKGTSEVEVNMLDDAGKMIPVGKAIELYEKRTGKTVPWKNYIRN